MRNVYGQQASFLIKIKVCVLLIYAILMDILLSHLLDEYDTHDWLSKLGIKTRLGSRS